jgi:hypothetical protein
VGRAFGVRPSDLLELDAAGYGPTVRLALDDAYLAFVQQFERMKEATTWVPDARQHRKAAPMKEVPVYTRDELLAYLDIHDDGEGYSPVIDSALDALDLSLWEQMPGWDDD